MHITSAHGAGCVSSGHDFDLGGEQRMRFLSTALRMILGSAALGAIATMASDPSTWGDKWSSGISGKQQAFVEGVQGTAVDPTALAIAAEGAMLQNVTQSITSGRWRNALARAGKAKWQNNKIAKAGNWTAAATTGKDAYNQAMQTWGPIIVQTAAAARAMPGGSLTNNLARANYLATTLYNRKRGL